MIATVAAGRGRGRAGELRKKAVAALAGFGEVFGAQGPPDAVFSERRGVHRVVQKPRAVVIPQVVVRIGRGAAQAGDGVERDHVA